MNEYLSIQDFASLVNKTQQGIYKRLKNPQDKLNNYVKLDDEGKKTINAAAAKELYGIEVEENSSKPEENSGAAAGDNQNNEIIKLLKEQIADQKKELDIKNQQIGELNDRLREITTTLDQQQKLAVMDKQKLIELEAKVAEADIQEAAAAAEEVKKHWWKFWG